jgi:hypothetical protein
VRDLNKTEAGIRPEKSIYFSKDTDAIEYERQAYDIQINKRITSEDKQPKITFNSKEIYNEAT